MMKSILSLFLLTGILYSAELSRNSDGIVSDSSTSLEWQDNTSSVQKTWSSAISYCEDLSLGGYDDWRLPNRNELLSILDYNKYGPAIKENVFQNITSDKYFSSSTFALSDIKAWLVDFRVGDMISKTKSSNLYVLCVRGGQ